MVLFTSGRKLHLGRRWGREHRRIGAGVVREAREERARGGRSKKAGSGRNYAVEKGLKGVSQEKRVGAGNARKWRREFWTLTQSFDNV